MNPIALQSALLPGATLDEQFAAAKAAGADGVELRADAALYEYLPETVEALERHSLRAAALRAGHTRLIHPEYAEREMALVAMRQALAASVDTGAYGVVFYGHYASDAVLPDLHPYKSSVELEAELLVAELRATLCDLAYALSAKLPLAHADSGSSVLLRRPEHAALIRAKLDNHPHLEVAVSLAHLDAEQLDAANAMSVAGLGYVCACDMGGALPGGGQRDWRAWASALRVNGYSGWITVEGRKTASIEALSAAVRTLREAGI